MPSLLIKAQVIQPASYCTKTCASLGHVLAAAIKTNANVIVTNNLKDFPEEYLDAFGLKAKSADDFLTDIIDLN